MNNSVGESCPPMQLDLVISSSSQVIRTHELGKQHLSRRSLFRSPNAEMSVGEQLFIDARHQNQPRITPKHPNF